MLVDAGLGEGGRCGSVSDPHLILIAADAFRASAQHSRLFLRRHQLADAALVLIPAALRVCALDNSSHCWEEFGLPAAVSSCALISPIRMVSAVLLASRCWFLCWVKAGINP